MNVIGLKANRKPSLIGEKMMNLKRVIGMKNLSKSDNIAVSNGNADITQMDSNIIDSQKMPTNIDMTKRAPRERNGLEKGNKQSV